MRHRPAWLALPAVLLLVSMLAAACLSGSQSGPRAARSEQGRRARISKPGPARSAGRARLVLRIGIAPFRLPVAVSGESVTSAGGKLLIAGGLLADQSSSDSVVRIDLRTGRSAAAGRLPVPVHDAASAVLGGALLVFGGGTAASYATVQRPTAGGGYVYGTLPASRSDLAAVAVGESVYLAGGHGNTGYARAVLATSDGRHFRTLGLLPVPVRYPEIAVAGGYLWVFGGLTPRGPVADVQRVNLRTGRADLAGRLPRPLEAGAAFTVDGAVYLVGGLTPARSDSRAASASPGMASLVTSSAVRRFSPGGWSFPVVGRLPVPVSHAGVTVAGGTAYLVGGLDGGRAVRTVTTFRLVRGSH